MGAWGTAIFSNDTSADVKSDFRDLVADGAAPEEISEQLLRRYGDDPDFWLGLAITQHRMGRVVESVRDRALSAIDDGSDLERWEGTERKRREAVLLRAKEELLSPPRPPTKARKRSEPQPDHTTLSAGDVIAYRWKPEFYTLLHIVDVKAKGYGMTVPVVQVLDWLGTTIPPAREIRRFAVRAHPRPQFLASPSLWDRVEQRDEAVSAMVVKRRIHEKPEERFDVVGRRRVSPLRVLRPTRSWRVLRWDEVDQYLDEMFPETS